MPGVNSSKKVYWRMKCVEHPVWLLSVCIFIVKSNTFPHPQACWGWGDPQVDLGAVLPCPILHHEVQSGLAGLALKLLTWKESIGVTPTPLGSRDRCAGVTFVLGMCGCETCLLISMF